MGLTMLRLLLLPLFLWALVADGNRPDRPYRWLALVVFGVMAVTDKLDGYLARRLNQTSRLGALLDPVADKLLIACSVIILSFDWIAPAGFAIPGWVVVAIYGKDLVTAIGALVLLQLAGKVTISPRPLGRASTVLQLSLVVAVLLAPAPTAGWAAGWKQFVVVLWWAIAVLAAMSCADYVRQGWLQLMQARRSMAKEATAGPGEGSEPAAAPREP